MNAEQLQQCMTAAILQTLKRSGWWQMPSGELLSCNPLVLRPGELREGILLDSLQATLQEAESFALVLEPSMVSRSGSNIFEQQTRFDRVHLYVFGRRV